MFYLCDVVMNCFFIDVVLIVVDLQLDFMFGGVLFCEDGDVIVVDIVVLLVQGCYVIVVVIQDWYLVDYVLFVSQYFGYVLFEQIVLYGYLQMLWLDYCVQGMFGVVLYVGVDWMLVVMILCKGCNCYVDLYSVFQENYDVDGQWLFIGLVGWLCECGIVEVYVCGLVCDYCVLWIVQDVVVVGFCVGYLWVLMCLVSVVNDDVMCVVLVVSSIMLC